MSNHFAISTVTATLRQMIEDDLSAVFTGSKVFILPPDDPELKKTGAFMNLFLYMVTPNAALRSMDAPIRRSDGSLSSNPRIGLDLHYLLTAYGASTASNPQMHALLGTAIRTLNGRPILTSNMIGDVVAQLDQPFPSSDLARSIEPVRVTMHPLTIDELSKLWTILSDAPYRPSVVYHASLVVLDGQDRVEPAPPVRERAVHVRTMQRPVLDRLDPMFLQPGDTLTLYGRNFSGEHIRVMIGDTPVNLGTADITDERISFPLSGGLKAGVLAVQVVRDLDLGTDDEPHGGFASNPAACILRPAITVAKDNISSTTLDGVIYRSGDLVITVNPSVGRSQRTEVRLNRQDPPSAADAHAYMPQTPADNGITDPLVTETTEIRVAFTRVVAGNYLVRLRVDGAENELGTDPVTGNYDSPMISL